MQDWSAEDTAGDLPENTDQESHCGFGRYIRIDGMCTACVSISSILLVGITMMCINFRKRGGVHKQFQLLAKKRGGMPPLPHMLVVPLYYMYNAHVCVQL